MTDVASVVEFEVTDEVQENTQLSREAIIQLGRFERLYRRLHNQRKKLFLPEDTLASFVPKKKDKEIVQLHLNEDEKLLFVAFLKERIEKYKEFIAKEIIVDEGQSVHESNPFILMQEEAQKSVAFLDSIVTAIETAGNQYPIEIAVPPILKPKSLGVKEEKNPKKKEEKNPKKQEREIEYKHIYDYLTAIIELLDKQPSNNQGRATIIVPINSVAYHRASIKYANPSLSNSPESPLRKSSKAESETETVSSGASRNTDLMEATPPDNSDIIEDLDLSHLDKLVLQVDALTMSSVAVKNAIEESDIAAYELQYGNKVKDDEKRILDENEKIIRAALPFLQFFEKNYTKRFTQAILTTETRRNTTYLNTHASRVYPSSGVLRGLQNAWNAVKIVASKLRPFLAPVSWVGFHTFFVHPAIAKRARRDIRQKEALQGKVLEAFVTLCVAQKPETRKEKQKLLAEAIDLVRARNKFVAQLIVDEGRRIVETIPNAEVKAKAQKALEKLIAQVEEDVLKDSSDADNLNTKVFKQLETALLKHFEGSQSHEVQEVKGKLKEWLNTIKDAKKRKDKKEQHYNTIKEQHIRVPGYLYRFQRRQPSTDAPQPDTSLMATARSEFRTLHRNFAAVSKKALRKVPENQQVAVLDALQELGALALAHQHQQAVRAAEANAALQGQTDAIEKTFLEEKRKLVTLLQGDAAATEKIIRQTLYRAPEVKKAVEHLNKRVEKYLKEKLEKQSEVITKFKGERFNIFEDGEKSKDRLIGWLEALKTDLADCSLYDQQQLETNTLLTAAIAELKQNEAKYSEKSNVVIYKLKLGKSLEELNLGKVPKWLNDDTGKDGVKGVASKRAIKQQLKKPWYKKVSLPFKKPPTRKRYSLVHDEVDTNRLGESSALTQVALLDHLAWYTLKQQEVQFWKALRVPSLKIKTLEEKEKDIEDNTANPLKLVNAAKSMHTTITTLITDIEKGFEKPIKEFSESIEGTPLQAITGIKKAIRDKLREKKYATLVGKKNSEISEEDAPALKKLGNELINVIKKEREVMMKDVDTFTFPKESSEEIKTEASKVLKSQNIDFGALPPLKNTIKAYQSDVTLRVKSFENHVKEEGRGGIQSTQPPVLNMHDPITYLGELILGVKINEKVLEIKDPKSDGNCLARAVADSLVGDKRLIDERKPPYQKVKDLCLKDIENNPKMYANIIQGTIAEQSQSHDTGAFTATTYIKDGIKTQYTQQQHLASKNSARAYEEVIDERFRALTKVDAKGNSTKLTEGEEKLLVAAYVKGIRQNPNAWGDNAIVKAVVEVFKINVNIYKKDGNRLIFVMTSTPEEEGDRRENTIDLLYTGNHYQSIVPSGRIKSLGEAKKKRLKKKELLKPT